MSYCSDCGLRRDVHCQCEPLIPDSVPMFGILLLLVAFAIASFFKTAQSHLLTATPTEESQTLPTEDPDGLYENGILP